MSGNHEQIFKTTSSFHLRITPKSSSFASSESSFSKLNLLCPSLADMSGNHEQMFHEEFLYLKSYTE